MDVFLLGKSPNHVVHDISQLQFTNGITNFHFEAYLDLIHLNENLSAISKLGIIADRTVIKRMVNSNLLDLNENGFHVMNNHPIHRYDNFWPGFLGLEESKKSDPNVFATHLVRFDQILGTLITREK